MHDMQLTTATDRNVRVVIERNESTTRNAAGDVVDSWQVALRRWAKVEQISGREMVNAHAVEAEATHTITLLYDSRTAEITPGMRCKIGNKVLNFVSVNNVDFLGRNIIIQAVEQVM